MWDRVLTILHVNRLDQRKLAGHTNKKESYVADDDQAEKVRQQMLADVERDRQAAAQAAQEAKDEAARQAARDKAEALAAFQAMEAKENERRNR